MTALSVGTAIVRRVSILRIERRIRAAQDSREVLVRQQLATVQEAVNNWASRQIGKVATNGGNPTTIEQVRVSYNAPTTATARLLLFQGYLDEATRAAITVNNTSGRLTTDAMLQTGYYLTLPTWSTGSYPKVQINP